MFCRLPFTIYSFCSTAYIAWYLQYYLPPAIQLWMLPHVGLMFVYVMEHRVSAVISGGRCNLMTSLRSIRNLTENPFVLRDLDGDLHLRPEMPLLPPPSNSWLTGNIISQSNQAVNQLGSPPLTSFSTLLHYWELNWIELHNLPYHT